MNQTLLKLVRLLRNTAFHPQWLIGPSAPTYKWIKVHATGAVLDVGCGAREVEHHLSASCHYHALDSLKTGKELYGSKPDLFASASNIPIANCSIDTVLFLDVIEHLRDPNLALEEIARVLRPGGSVLMTVPFLYPIHDAPFDFQRYTIHGLRRDLTGNGFQIDELQPSVQTFATAGLIVSLTLGATILDLVARPRLATLLVPIIYLAIPIVNITAWAAAIVLPQWPAVAAGYRICARKPIVDALVRPPGCGSL